MTSTLTSLGKLKDAQCHVPDSSSCQSRWGWVMGKGLFGLYFTVFLLQGTGYIARAGSRGMTVTYSCTCFPKGIGGLPRALF